MNKECAACGWDGLLTTGKCSGCGEEKTYCFDCFNNGKPFNCGACQAPETVIATDLDEIVF